MLIIISYIFLCRIFDDNDPPEAVKSKCNDTVIQHKHHKSKPHFRPIVVDFEDDEDELQYVSEECEEYTTPHEGNLLYIFF